MRLGVVSDLHHELAPPRARAWINPYDPEGLPGRLRAALEWFTDEGVDHVVICGDVVERPVEADLDAAFAAIAAGPRPAAMVAGNHDWSPDGLTLRAAAAHSVARLHEAALPGELPIAGVAITPSDGSSLRFRTDGHPPGAGVRVIVSHFPVLGEAQRLATAGLPYPGDLTDRADLERRLRAEEVPLVVLSGHIHARCARADGALLQLAAGALIEPPHDAAIVTVTAEPLTVERVARRLGPAGRLDPVFAPDGERWRWAGERWAR